MRALELLSPAKNLACGIAAVDHGADAVYIGAPRFGARAAVGNSISDIRQLCDYAHLFGVKVYATVNTILYDSELDAACQLIQQLQEAGVDAVLVQDMALTHLLQNNSLTSHLLPLTSNYLHASTQTDNRTPEKVRWLRDLGFSRVVLARELSVTEIAEIHREVPDVELEVFVHGALCVSYSGLCYASQHCFGRSANRGECAQFCRMKFSLEDAEGREVARDRYLLSLKDLNQSDHLLELVEAGATSFKIEGRLKDIAYVKNVTAAYSQLLNDIVRRYPDQYCRSSLGVCRYTFKPDLRRTFNRGYTTYFLHGRQPDIASFDTPKAIGEYVGQVKEIRSDSFNVAGVASFANGDGLCFIGKDRQLEGFRANRVVGNRIYPYRMPQGLQPGMRLYRNSDQEFDRLLSKPSADRRIPIRMSLRAVDGGFELNCQLSTEEIVNYPLSIVHYQHSHQLAQRPQRENIVRQLTKLGDTIYTCDEVDIPANFNYFIPNSVLSDMRRQLVEEIRCKVEGGRWKEKCDRRKVEGGRCKENSSNGRSNLPPPSTIHLPPNLPNLSYLYNISNQASRRFYGASDLTAYELKGGDGPIMQCRYCIRYALGYCVRHGGQRPEWREPLSLVLGDGRRFPLEFDCRNCQMNVYTTNNKQ